MLNTGYNIFRVSILPNSVFGHFKGKLSVIKVTVSIFGQAAVYRIYTVSREPIRLPEIQHPVFLIVFNKSSCFFLVHDFVAARNFKIYLVHTCFAS